MKRLFQQNNGKGERLLDKIHQLKATPLFRMGDDKESDPSAISWEDEKEGLEKFCLFIKKELYPLLEPPFKIGQNAAYEGDSILDVLMYMAVYDVTSENGSKGFKSEYKEGPSGRTIRRRLENLELLDVKAAFFKANNKILSFFRNKRKYKKVFFLFKKGKGSLVVLISIDKTDNPCYGKQRKYACGMQRKKGTNYGYRYASVVVSVAGINVTLFTMPMTEFTTNPEMLEKLITEARKYVDIKTLLIDREFSNSPCIEKLEELHITYVTPVIEHQTAFLQSLRPPCKATMPLGSIEVPIVAIRDPDDPENILYYATNLDVPVRSLERVIKIYRKRWIIENNFKAQKLEFLAKTYSVNITIRYFLWILATLLHNAWILCNFCATTAAKVKLCDRERPLITAFEYMIKMKITFLSPLFSNNSPEEGLPMLMALAKEHLLKNPSDKEVLLQYIMDI